VLGDLRQGALRRLLQLLVERRRARELHARLERAVWFVTTLAEPLELAMDGVPAESFRPRAALALLTDRIVRDPQRSDLDQGLAWIAVECGEQAQALATLAPKLDVPSQSKFAPLFQPRPLRA
jgi:hypothetical protein